AARAVDARPGRRWDDESAAHPRDRAREAVGSAPRGARRPPLEQAPSRPRNAPAPADPRGGSRPWPACDARRSLNRLPPVRKLLTGILIVAATALLAAWRSHPQR